MHRLSIDIETYSSVDIKKSGMYKYVQSPDFEILLLAFVYDSQPVLIKDLTKQVLPDHFFDALLDPDTIKYAYNAAFEWYCLSKYIQERRPNFDPVAWLSQWRCTMLHGLYCGFPAGLSAVGDALGLPQDKRKLGVGMSLIRTFCIPQKPTRTNGMRTRILPHHEPEKWELFKTYCMQDVATEMAVNNKLQCWPVPESEQHLWELDQEINARGVAIDSDLVTGALAVSEIITGQLMDEARRISGLDNPKSVKQLLDWINSEMGDDEEDLADLQKKTVKDLLKRDDIDSPDARRILEIRQELGKTSVTKYAAMQAAVCDDGRVRGLLQFYGANRTGRWAGRLVQVQNLPRNYLDSLDLARDLVKQQRVEDLKWIYGTVPDTLSQLIRTAFVPNAGGIFCVADFSAIEARVIAWLAGETWRQDVFATHGKIYEASASAMFGVPIDKIKKGNPEYALRQKGKIAELALGYQGGKGALIQMGALDMGLTEDELPDIVSRWRQANKRIVDLWYKFETAAVDAIYNGKPVPAGMGVIFAREMDNNGLDFLTIQLPSGRKLFYAFPGLGKNQWGNESITYRGTDQKTKKWGVLETYGGKLVENVVQAIARDCLAVALLRLDAEGFRTVMHIHDECVIDVSSGDDEAGDDEDELKDACAIMGHPIDWAPGLLLRADGFVTPYYKKD